LAAEISAARARIASTGFSVSNGELTLFGVVAAGVLGSIPWVLALALIGRGAGDNCEHWRHNLGYAVLAAIVAGAIYWVVKRRRSGGGAAQPVDPRLSDR
jgi:membrane protein DedA with SNARE-associated domain